MTNSVEPEKPFGRELATTSRLHLPLSQTQTRTQSQCQSPSVLFPLFVLYLGKANIVPLSTGRRAASKIKFQLQRCVYATQFFHRQVVGPLAPSFRPGPDHPPSSFRLQFALFAFTISTVCCWPRPEVACLFVCCFYRRSKL